MLRSKQMPIAGYKFTTALGVRGGQVDQQGVVSPANLTYFDVGITEYWRAIGPPYPTPAGL